MSHGGGTHGPRQDDALKHETQSEVQGRHATRVEEWREPEPAGEDQPEATWAPAGERGGVPPGETPEGIQTRSELARFLGRHTFPTDRAGLVEDLTAHNAPQQLVDAAAGLPAGTTFNRLADVLEALGLPPRESRRT
jgi:hypothetical protein